MPNFPPLNNNYYCSQWQKMASKTKFLHNSGQILEFSHLGYNIFTLLRCLYYGYNNFLFWFFSGAEDHHAHVWHRQAGGKLATLRGHTNVVNCVAFNPTDQQMLVSASDDHTLRVWKSRQLTYVTEENQQKQKELSPESSV